MCEREREEPHCYRCASPQLIALCVGVSPLYSTPDKMCVSVHDACNDKRPNKVRWACTVCLHHACHATPYASLISRNIWQNYKKIVFWTQILKQTMWFRGAILFCMMNLAVQDRSYNYFYIRATEHINCSNADNDNWDLIPNPEWFL